MVKRDGLAVLLLTSALALTACDAGRNRDDERSVANAAAAAEAARRAPAHPSAGTRRLTKLRRMGCPKRGRTVRDAESLRRALADARPGDVIRMADGTYAGGFVIERSGTRPDPIFLCGSRDAVLDGEDDTDYVLHLDGAEWWRLVGFSVVNGQKGVMADRARHNVLFGLYVGTIGDEAVHLRTFSTDNVVVGNTVRDTGHRNEKFGEGIYVGSAHSNWCEYTDCKPDTSDRNAIIGNDIADTTSESIDIKEGTAAGVIARNRMSGKSITGDPDSWIDIKGNGWLVERNVGTDSPEDGIQTHVEYEGWGRRNEFRANRLTVNGPGYGIYVHEEERSRNLVRCDNVVTGAEQGLSNVSCRGHQR
jgi:Right handed beta helix region